LRPTAAAVEGCAEITGKWAKKAEKEYDLVNAEAGKYFSLLAVSHRSLNYKSSLIRKKETRSHDAYRSGVSKRHAHAGESIYPSWLSNREGISQIRKIVDRDFIDPRRSAPPAALLVNRRTEG
jgi:hypothetical protein